MKLFYEFSDFDLKVEIPDEFKIYFNESWGKIKTSNYCGAMKIGDETIAILPKIDKANQNENIRYLIYMISYVNDIKMDETDSLTGVEQSPLIEFLISIFCRDLLFEVERGLYREYISRQENIRTLKGRYLAGLDTRHNFFHDKIYCEFDEFSPDNTLNALFAHTVKLCRQLTTSDENRKMLSALSLMFDEVESTYQNKPFVFGRLNERFKKPYSLAMFILNNLSVNFGSSGKNEWAFMFDMNLLFEKFIAKILAEALPEYEVSEQEKSRFGEKNSKPDIVVRKDGKVFWIIDTKYKKVDANRDISPCDTYQVFAYANIADFGDNTKQVMLLYPQHLEELGRSVELPNDVTMKIKSVELQTEGNSFDIYIAKLKNNIARIIND